MKYSVKAAAIATGVSESRLRTWERRYGVPRPGRSGSGRRQYDEDDLATIRRMAALVNAGVPASEAAEAVKNEAPVASAPIKRVDHPLALELVDFFRAYDEAGAQDTIRRAVAELGWEEATDRVLLAALHQIGRAWQEERIITANEHFASEIIRREIACAATQPSEQRSRHSVMLACAEDERHDIGLLALGLLLRLRGLRVYYIGADVPGVDLVSAVTATKVDAVVLAATLSSSLSSLERTARSFVSGAARVKLYVGGPAFHADADSISVPGVRLPQRVDEAARLIAETLAGAGKEHS